jgi:hypothetical protein
MPEIKFKSVEHERFDQARRAIPKHKETILKPGKKGQPRTPAKIVKPANEPRLVDRSGRGRRGRCAWGRGVASAGSVETRW